MSGPGPDVSWSRVIPRGASASREMSDWCADIETLDTRTSSIINVKDPDFGADPTKNIAWNTAAFQAAIDAQEAAGNGSANKPTIYAPPADWILDQLNWQMQADIVGDSIWGTRLIYGGAGGAGTKLFNNPSTESTFFGGLRNMQVRGWSPGAGVVENILKMTGTADPEFGVKFDNIQFIECGGNAIDFEASLNVVNLHLQRIRFDRIGGFALAVKRATGGIDYRPMSLDRFSWDNDVPVGAFATQAIADGFYDGTEFGKGLLSVVDAATLHVHLSNGRIEGAAKQQILHDTRKCAVFVNNTLSGSVTYIIMTNVVGILNKKDAAVGVFSKSGRVNVNFRDFHLSDAAANFEEFTTRKIIPRWRKDAIFSASDVGNNAVGFGFNENVIEFRNSAPASNVQSKYTKGDFIYNADMQGPGSPNGWIVERTDDRFREPSGLTFSNMVNVQNGSAIVTVLDTTTFDEIHVDMAIRLEGAGPASADLDTFVLSVDHDNDQFTVFNAASTTQNPGDLTLLAPTFTPVWFSRSKLGIQTFGDEAATLIVGTDESTNVWDTALTADRAVALSTTGAVKGAKFRIVRTANATGAFNLNVGTGPLKAMGTAGSFSDVEYDGSAWVLTAYGTL